jgi:hypothetical protein
MTMRAVVVYESMYGNTHMVADAIAAGITRLLGAHGFDVAAEPESFLVTRQDRLAPGELARAREWGSTLAAGIIASQAPSIRS